MAKILRMKTKPCCAACGAEIGPQEPRLELSAPIGYGSKFDGCALRLTFCMEHMDDWLDYQIKAYGSGILQETIN